MDVERQANFDPTSLAFYSLTIGQIALVVFGVLQVSSEYTTGTIRASLAAVPRRGLSFGTKVLVGMLIAAVLSVVVAFGTGLAEHGTTLGAPGVLRAVLGAAAYLTLMCGFRDGCRRDAAEHRGIARHHDPDPVPELRAWSTCRRSTR